jgi:hypothetical protein
MSGLVMSDQKATPDFAETLDKIAKGRLHGQRMTHAGVVVTAADADTQSKSVKKAF